MRTIFVAEFSKIQPRVNSVSFAQDAEAARRAEFLQIQLRLEVHQQTGIDRSALSKLENVTNENPTIETLLRYAEVVGKRIDIQVLDR